jgi:hypothetical protein
MEDKRGTKRLHSSTSSSSSSSSNASTPPPSSFGSPSPLTSLSDVSSHRPSSPVYEHDGPFEGIPVVDLSSKVEHAFPDCHTPVLKEVNQSLHTCSQDVQITRTTNSKVNNSQCYGYNIIRAYLL